MKTTQEKNEARLERLDWQLSILAIVVISILALGLALFMFPAVFGEQSQSQTGPVQERYFFSFRILVLLFNVYLVQRHASVLSSDPRFQNLL